MTAGSRIRTAFAASCLLLAIAAPAASQVDTWAVRGGNIDDRAARDRIAETAPEISGFDVLLILVDGLDTASLGCYGGAGQNTHAIDALADGAFRFTNAFAVSPHRLSSLLSILDSQYPTTLNAIGDMTKSETAGTVFRDRGYRCFLGMNPSVLTSPGEPVGKIMDALGFDRRAWSRARSAEPFVEMVADHLATRRLGEPIFGVLHYGQAYPPAFFHPGKDFGTTPEAHGRAALAYVDDGIAGVVGAMRKEKTLAKTIVVITSPNGLAAERTRGEYRQDELTDAALRVPLLVRVPGVEGRVIDDVVETIEIVPTLMTLLDHEHDFSLQGRSFADLMFDVASADAPPRYAFAGHLPFAGEPLQDARSTIRTAHWRLTTAADLKGATALDVTGKGERATAEVITSLLRSLEDVVAYTHTTSDMWRRGTQAPPDLRPVGRLAARASWLAAIGDPRATDAVRHLIKSGEGDMRTAIRVLLAAGTDADVGLARGLLEHDDPDVAALAGAFLVKHGAAETGLDYAISGLRTGVPTEVVLPLLRNLARSGSRRARSAIERYTPGPLQRTLVAERDLALARLGSEDARDRLAQHLLAPHVGYDKRPYIAALREYRPKRAPGLIELCLTDGDDASNGVMLEAIAHDDSARPARAVAAALDNVDPGVRARAFSMLRAWGSLEGFAGAVALLRGETRDVSTAAWELVSCSALIGSPLMPGARFDQNPGQFLGKDGRLLGGLPDIGSGEFEFTVSGVDRTAEFCALVFDMPDDTNPDDVKIRVRINDGWTRQISLTPEGSHWMWVGVPPATKIESGANRVGIDVAHTERGESVEAVARAFAFLPVSTTTARPLAAIETRPLLDPERPPIVTATTHDADFVSYHLWLSARDAGMGGKADRVIVKVGGEVVVSGALPQPDGERRVHVPLPEGTRHGTRIELLYEDRSPAANASIVLIGDR